LLAFKFKRWQEIQLIRGTEEASSIPQKHKAFSYLKEDVTPYDIFRLAQYILIVAGGFYLLLALIRIFYTDKCNAEGIKEVWEYSKVFLNSIVSLVLGLYFGARHNTK
jgi:hypothetical protein